MSVDFDAAFEGLTGYKAFRWQRRLFEETVGGTEHAACDIPTGLGKTSVIPIWLIALAAEGEAARVAGDMSLVKLPRRLVYVVDRRTVVDQATDVALKIRERLHERLAGDKLDPVRTGLEALAGDPDDLLAISTLRGELADNRKWQADPARPAIIVGTVDMIGSRLLFSGYGVSRRMRPFHAGLLGQDALIVHDEAHLSPAFGALVNSIAGLQRGQEPRPIRVMELSATRRQGAPDGPAFRLTEDERQEEPVALRLEAPKALVIEGPVTADGLAERLAGKALERANALSPLSARIAVYVRSPDMAKKVSDRLAKEIGDKAGNRVVTLTGTIRGHERDRLVNSEPFAGFGAKPGRVAPPETEFLVATSAGEVGIDLDADHMVCDLTSLDSMIQRLGRVNRLGEGRACIDVIHAAGGKKPGEEDPRILATRKALESLPLLADGARDASPQALKAMVDRLGPDSVEGCFSEMPRLAELTDVLLDGWAMTSAKDLPGVPPVERWLRGINPGDPPSVHVAWRSEIVDVPDDDIGTLVERYPVLARERVRGNLGTVTDELRRIARRFDSIDVVLLPPRGDPRRISLPDLIKDQNALREATVVLPCGAGGLDGRGMLDGSEKAPVEDVGDTQDRSRVLLKRDADSGTWSARLFNHADPLLDIEETDNLRKAIKAAKEDEKLDRMVEKAMLVLERDDEGDASRVLLLLARYGSIDAAEDSQESLSRMPVLLCHHNSDVEAEARSMVDRLAIEALIREAVGMAAERHDLGKDRAPWQKAIGHPPPYGDYGDWKPWAKSVRKGFDRSACSGYRHEFGSLREASLDPLVLGCPERDLILHLIAAHHGWARPHFSDTHWDIAKETSDETNAEVAIATLRRFARLQRRFGRWGLAWLESLMRAADYRVSSGNATHGTRKDLA